MNEEAKSKKVRAERADKAVLNAILGAFLLIAGVCIGVWVFTKYEDSRTYFYDIPPARNARGEIVSSDELRHRGTWDEAVLGAAAGLICLSGAGFLLVRAARIYRRTKHVAYEEIDWRALEKPSGRIEVRATRFQTALGIGLVVFFALLTLGILKQLFASRFSTTADFIYKGGLLSGFIFSLISVFIFLMIRAKCRTVRFFDERGVTRGDGRHLSWSDFRGTRTRTGTSRYALVYVWRIELVFASGETAWLIPQRIKNSAEVFGFVNRLPPAVP